MKTIIAGSRDIGSTMYNDRRIQSACTSVIEHAVKESGFNITEVVSGCAFGVDKLGETWAEDNSIPIVKFPADWDLHGRKAGYVRNAQMAEYADALIAIWDGKSKGTANMIELAKNKELKVYVFCLEG